MEIVIGAKDDAPVDIILAAGETNYNLESFKPMLETALHKAGVDLARVKIDAAETSSMEVADYDADFILKTWKKWGNNTAVYKYDSAQRAIADTTYHCLRSGYFDKNAEILENSEVAIECDVVAYDHSCNNYFGLTFRQNGSRDYYTVVWQDRPGTQCGMMAGQPYVGMALLKVQGCDIDLSSKSCREGTHDKRCQHATLLKSYNPGAWVAGKTYNLKASCDAKGNIEITLDGKVVMSYKDLNPLPDGTYGFISVGHSGSKPASILFKDIKVSKSAVKDLVDVVRAPDWRPRSHRFVVDVCDLPREDFQDEEKLGELVQRVSTDSAYYVGLGKTASEESLTQFISRNHGKGKYIDNQRGDVYDELASYIASIVNKTHTGSGDVYLIKDKEYIFTHKET